MAKKKADLKAIVEEGIKAVLEDKTTEPSDGRLKALALGIKMCALNAKLEESEYGDFFTDPAEPGHADVLAAGTKGEKPGRRRRANGTGDGDADTLAS